jgi:hypothetical protein
MNESQIFSFRKEEPYLFRNKEWHCAVQLFEDRIGYSWDAFGFGVDKGKTVLVRSELAQVLGEYSGATPLIAKFGRLPGIYLVLALFAYVCMPSPWRYSTFVFLAFFIISAFKAISSLRK